tara:strand:- start:1161 stop:1352 length:192 start_codon:yes stop_codon:yes gene_type:complete
MKAHLIILLILIGCPKKNKDNSQKEIIRYELPEELDLELYEDEFDDLPESTDEDEEEDDLLEN